MKRGVVVRNQGPQCLLSVEDAIEGHVLAPEGGKANA